MFVFISLCVSIYHKLRALLFGREDCGERINSVNDVYELNKSTKN